MRVILVATDASPPAPARKDPGAVVVNVKRREIWRLGRVAEFRNEMQFRFAATLVASRGALLTYDEFIDALYGDDADGGPLWASYAASRIGRHVKNRLSAIGLMRHTVYGHGVKLAKDGQGFIAPPEPPARRHHGVPGGNRRYVRREGGAQ